MARARSRKVQPRRRTRRGVAKATRTRRPRMSSPAQAPPDVVQRLSGDERFATLVTLVKRAMFVKGLSSEGPFTVFAPTDEAFRNVPPATMKTIYDDVELLKRVLGYHVVYNAIPSSEITGPADAETMIGEMLSIEVEDGGVVINGSAKVVEADIAASNGIIHAIDAVLIPDDVAESL